MACPAETSHPWDPEWKEEWKMSVRNNEVILSTLTEYSTAILKTVDLSEKFWNLLLQHGVVDENAKTRIQGYIQRQLQATALVLHMMTVEVYKFHSFIWALVNSHQCQLAELLGFAVRDYLDVDVYLMSSSFHCPACQEFYTKAYILTGCGHYVCAPCVKGAQFICKDNMKEDITCPVPECGKITEASPSAGNIGLEEDGDFSVLCQAMHEGVTKESAGTPEGKSTTETKEEEGKSTTANKEEDNLSQRLQGGITDLETKISRLQKYRGVLGEYKPGVKDYITDKVEKFKQNIDEWAKETLGWYSSVCQQVETNLQKSVKWLKAASELTELMRARPGLLEGSLKDKVNLPEEIVTYAGEKLITKLNAGCPIPPLFPYNPCISILPTKAKFLMNCEVGTIGRYRKVAWMSDGSLMGLTNEAVWKLNLDTDTAECKPRFIQEISGAYDMSVATDGTWILCNGDDIEIHYPNLKEVKQWNPEGENIPRHVFINKDNIFVGECDSQIIRSYSRELVYVDQYDIGTKDDFGKIHVTERSRLLKSSYTEGKIYAMDLETKKASSFGSEGEGDGELSHPRGVCTVNDNEYILVCDNGNNRVSVFTHDGQFIHHLDVEGGIQMPYIIAVLARKGKPTLMAVGEKLNGKDALQVYSLE